MSQENVEIVRRAFEAFNRTYAAGTTDLSEFLDFLDPDVEWVPSWPSSREPPTTATKGCGSGSRTQAGLGGVRAEARAVPGPGRRSGLGPGLVACAGPGGEALLDIPQAAWLIQIGNGRVVRLQTFTERKKPSKPPGSRSR